MRKRSKRKQEKEERPDLMIRAASVEVRAGEGDAPASVRMSVSSDEPVLSHIYFNDQWQRAYEVLDHSAAAVDMSRAKDGLVILDRHYGDQVGIMDVEVRDNKLGGFVKFGAGERSQVIAADAATGIRKNVSVGYQVDSSSYRLDGERDGIPIVRAMRWTPYEASFEPVPADPTVGVGRSKNNPAEPAKEEQKRTKTMKPEDIAKLYERAAKYGVSADKVTSLVGDNEDIDAARAGLDSLVIAKQDKDNEGLRAEVKEVKERKAEKPAAPEAKDPGPIGGSREEEAKVTKRYSVLNVLRHASGDKSVDIGFEREINDECRKADMGSRQGGNFIIPHAVLGNTRDFTVSGTSSASVSTDLHAGDFIDLLRTRIAIGEAGVKFMTGLVGDVAIPKMTAGSTGYWVAENGAITESQPTLGQVTGSPNTCGVMTDISRRLLLQSTPDAEALVRDELVARIARTVQIAVFQGTGADGQPSAITNASGINNPAIAVAGTPTYAEILAFRGAIMADNAEQDGQKWIGTAEVWEKLAATKKDAGSGDFVLNSETDRMLGRDYLTTEDVGANSLFFGAWNSVCVGVWGAGIDLNLDTATLSSSGGLRIVGLQDVDVMVRLGQALAYNAAVTA